MRLEDDVVQYHCKVLYNPELGQGSYELIVLATLFRCKPTEGAPFLST